MSHFYGTLQGSRGKVTRCGTRSSGVTTVAAGWHGAVRVDVWEKDGQDHFRVVLMPWQGSGGYERILAEGKLDSTSGGA